MEDSGLQDKEILALLVEDSASDQILFMHACNNFSNFNIVTATTVKNAIKLLEQYDFDIVFSDLNLLDSSGSESITGILKQKNDTLVVAMTGFLTRNLKEDAIKAGAKDFILKSDFNANNLKKCLSNLGFQLKTF